VDMAQTLSILYIRRMPHLNVLYSPQVVTSPANMVQFNFLVACGLALLPSLPLAVALPRSCPDGLCLVTRANVTSVQIQRELGVLVSSGSKIYGSNSTAFGNLTSRYQAYMPPPSRACSPGRTGGRCFNCGAYSLMKICCTLRTLPDLPEIRRLIHDRYHMPTATAFLSM